MIDAGKSVVGVVRAQDAAEIWFRGETIEGLYLVDCLYVRQHGRIVKRRLAAPLHFVISIDKRFIFLQWAADRAAELILAQHVGPGSLQEIDGIHLVVAEVFIERTVPLIGAAARNDIDDAGGGAAELRGIVGGDFAKLLHQLLRRSAALNSVPRGDVLRALDGAKVVMTIFARQGTPC